jgi:phenylpyruvate tautomerase PptA (4-oxalocrotonate tautomerase family)
MWTVSILATDLYRKVRTLFMPYLQLDVPARYSLDVKRGLARRLGNLYAEIMQTTPDLVDVSIRELEDAVWHCGYQEPVPGAVLMAEIRRGRPAEQRARLAEALMDACVETLAIDPTQMAVEFTQHAGDEIYRKLLVGGVLRGGLGKDWSVTETTTALFETLKAQVRQRKSAATLNTTNATMERSIP